MAIAAPTFACKAFTDLTARELYDMLALRSRVFVVEQQCVYHDPDGLDLAAHHLFAWADDGADLAGGARILAPGVAYVEPSIGRVVTSPRHRGAGIGRLLMARAMEECERLYPRQGIRIGAQQYLERFYASLGFVAVSAPYEEDGIRHVTMLHTA